MGLLDEVQQAQAVKVGGPRCGVAVVKDRLAPRERDELEAALADPTIFTTTVQAVLHSRGLKVSDTSLSRHRRGICACPR